MGAATLMLKFTSIISIYLIHFYIHHVQKQFKIVSQRRATLHEENNNMRKENKVNTLKKNKESLPQEAIECRKKNRRPGHRK